MSEDQKFLELSMNNEKIIQYLTMLREQRAEMTYLIRSQEEEKDTLQMEMERIAYKIALIEKGLVQRLMARDKYDQTIMEAEQFYERIVESSEVLLGAVQKDAEQLEETMDKKVGTDPKEKLSKEKRMLNCVKSCKRRCGDDKQDQ